MAMAALGINVSIGGIGKTIAAPTAGRLPDTVRSMHSDFMSMA